MLPVRECELRPVDCASGFDEGGEAEGSIATRGETRQSVVWTVESGNEVGTESRVLWGAERARTWNERDCALTSGQCQETASTLSISHHLSTPSLSARAPPLSPSTTEPPRNPSPPPNRDEPDSRSMGHALRQRGTTQYVPLHRRR